MNLIERELERMPLLEYRQYQMDLIPDMIDIILDYLIKNGIAINKPQTVIKIKDSANNSIYRYSGSHYSNITYSVTVNDQLKDPFMFLHIPKLENNMFTLNGSRYIPMMYMADRPITFKKKSILIYSLFSSLTFEKKSRRVIYEGSNIPISRFLRIFYDDADIPLVIPEFEPNLINETRDRSLLLLSSIFNTPQDWIQLRTKINDLFFDRWTLGLYRELYGFDSGDLKDVIDHVRDNMNRAPDDSFIDLNYKRIIFLEQLLLPVFRATQNMVVQNLKGESNGNIIKLRIGKPSEIATYFFTHMNGSTLYESVNCYSSLTVFKASFKRPGLKSNLPSCVSSIHSSYKGVIDPVVVSNSNPGEIVALVPTTDIDMKYGAITLPDQL